MTRRAIPVLLILAAPLLVLIPEWGKYAYPVGSEFSDLTISHLPNLVYLRNAIHTWGGVPLWSNTILSGYPFAANPLSSLWYPPAWLLILFPAGAEVVGFNILIWLHLLWGGVGMYAFLRSSLGSSRNPDRLQSLPALVGALSFELMPKLFGHFAAGHVTLVFSVCWTPWLFWAHEKSLQESHRAWDRLLLPGVVLAMAVLADPRWGGLVGLIWGGYAFNRAIILRRTRSTLQIITPMFITPVVAGLLAAPILLPLFEFIGLSTRQGMTAADRLTFSLPPGRLLGMLFPDIAGYAEWQVYPGALAIVSLIWLVAHPQRVRQRLFWVAMVGLSLLISFGTWLPGMEFLTEIPGLSLLRVPSRILFAAGFAFAVLTAWACQGLLLLDKSETNRGRAGSELAIAGVVMLAIALAAAVMLLGDGVLIDYLWGAVALLVFGIIFILRQRLRIGSRSFMLLLLPFVILDVGGVSISQVEFRLPQEVQAERISLAEELSGQDDLYRIYSPSYSLGQYMAARSGLEFASGIDPLQLSDYARFLNDAGGVKNAGYQVPLPPLMEDNIYRSNLEAVPSAKKLGLLSVLYLIANYPINAVGWSYSGVIDGVYVYENQYWLPRAWVQPPDTELGDSVRPVNAVDWRPNSININADGPGLLVLSEIDYPGWIVEVDGVRAPLEAPAGILRGVNLGEGTHQIHFVFRPVSVYLGLTMAGATILICLVVCINYLVRRRHDYQK